MHMYDKFEGFPQKIVPSLVAREIIPQFSSTQSYKAPAIDDHSLNLILMHKGKYEKKQLHNMIIVEAWRRYVLGSKLPLFYTSL